MPVDPNDSKGRTYYRVKDEKVYHPFMVDIFLWPKADDAEAQQLAADIREHLRVQDIKRPSRAADLNPEWQLLFAGVTTDVAETTELRLNTGELAKRLHELGEQQRFAIVMAHYQHDKKDAPDAA